MSEDKGKKPEEGVKVPGEEEGQDGTKTFEQDQEQLVEQQARAKGWRPATEFSDDDDQPAEFISAREFLAREPLFDKIREQNKSIKNLRKTVEAMVNQHETQVAAQVKRRLKELEEQRDEAIDEGNKEAVRAIDKEIDEQKTQLKEDQKKLPAELESWIGENPWFEENKEMRDFAITHNKTVHANNPGMDIEASLQKTLDAVKRAYPDQFKQEKAPDRVNPGGKPAGPDDGGGEPKDKKTKKYSVDRLTPEQKLVYEQHVNRYKILEHDEFFKGLEAIGELQ